jgi:hypothetical protein
MLLDPFIEKPQDQILRLLNLQLQRQRCCSRLEHFYIKEKIFLFYKRSMVLVAL